MSHPIYKMSFASVYPHYVTKAEKKDRTKAQVDELICWLTGYDDTTLAEAIDDKRAATGLRTSKTRSCKKSATWTKSLTNLHGGRSTKISFVGRDSRPA